jgi:hypothetical protein
LQHSQPVLTDAVFLEGFGFFKIIEGHVKHERFHADFGCANVNCAAGPGRLRNHHLSAAHFLRIRSGGNELYNNLVGHRKHLCEVAFHQGIGGSTCAEVQLCRIETLCNAGEGGEPRRRERGVGASAVCSVLKLKNQLLCMQRIATFDWTSD